MSPLLVGQAAFISCAAIPSGVAGALQILRHLPQNRKWSWPVSGWSAWSLARSWGVGFSAVCWSAPAPRPGYDSSKPFKGHLGGVTAALTDGSSKGGQQYFFSNSNLFKSCVCEICSSEEGTENRVGSCLGFWSIRHQGMGLALGREHLSLAHSFLSVGVSLFLLSPRKWVQIGLIFLDRTTCILGSSFWVGGISVQACFFVCLFVFKLFPEEQVSD